MKIGDGDMERFLDYHGNEGILEMGEGLLPIPPRHVLILVNLNNQWVLTKHKTRGLEFPGGKVEQGETLEEAAAREAYEETGAVISTLKRIGTYMIKGEEPFAKAIFFAEADSVEQKNDYLETDGPQLWNGDLDSLQEDDAFSFIMKDKVIRMSMKYLRENHYIQK